jgi:hypothetical protein
MMQNTTNDVTAARDQSEEKRNCDSFLERCRNECSEQGSEADTDGSEQDTHRLTGPTHLNACRLDRPVH